MCYFFIDIYTIVTNSGNNNNNIFFALQNVAECFDNDKFVIFFYYAFCFCFFSKYKYLILHLIICKVNISERWIERVFLHCLCLSCLLLFVWVPFKKSVPFVHRHAGSGRPTSAPWKLLAWQRSRSSMTASTHMLHALMSSGTIHLWWYVAVQTWCVFCHYL